jgi:hypothetical protein
LESWHLDKRVPIAMIAALLFQTAGLVWWAAKLDGRVGELEREVARLDSWQASNGRLDARMSVLEAQNTEIQRSIIRLEGSVQRIWDRRAGTGSLTVPQ